MAEVTLSCEATFTPAYHALLEVVTRIAEAHGEDRALEWGRKAIEADGELFVRIEVVPERPHLRLVSG